MIPRKNKKSKARHERRARPQVPQASFRRGTNLNLQRLHKIAAEQSSQRHKQTKARTHKLIRYLFLVIFFAVVAWFLLTTKVNNVIIKTPEARVDKATQERLQDNVLRTIDSNWLSGYKPFVSKADIAKNLQSSSPEIDKVNVGTSLLGQDLTVDVKFKQPVLIWQTKNGQRFYVDDSGQTFKTNRTRIHDDNLVHLYDTSGIVTSPGVTVASSEQIQFVTSVNKQLQQLNIKVEQYSIPASSKQIDIRLVGEPYVVKMLSSNDAGQAVAQLKQSLGFFKKQPNQTPQKYLDLRIIGKAFYQ